LKVGPLVFGIRVEATAPVNRPTPAPAAKQAAEASDDESIAAMLLSLQDESGSESGSGDPVPEGSTVMDLQSPLKEAYETAEKAKEKDKPKDKKQEPGNTSSAAKAILEKYMRRPRQ